MKDSSMNLKAHGWLLLIQIAWILLAVLSLAEKIWSLQANYQSANAICTDSIIACHSTGRASLQDVASLRVDGITLEQWAIYQNAYRIFVTMIFCAVGLLIFAFRRNNPPVLFMALALWLFGTLHPGGFMVDKYPQFALLNNFLTWLTWVSFPILFITFPNGRIVPRFMWIFIFVWSLLFALSYINTSSEVTDNPLYMLLAGVAFTSMFGGSVASQVYRFFRISNVEERRQTKWVVTGVTIWISVVLMFLVVPPFSQALDSQTLYSKKQMIFSITSNLSFILLPISIGIAILRNRLWDIDLIIRRTLVYSLLTGLLALIYFGGVTLLQSLFTLLSGQQSPAALVISTLLIAALFNPLRRRIQDFIDRRFYRLKYNAEQSLAAFASAARSEADLELLTNNMLGIVQATLQPEHVLIWMRPKAKSRATNQEKS